MARSRRPDETKVAEDARRNRGGRPPASAAREAAGPVRTASRPAPREAEAAAKRLDLPPATGPRPRLQAPVVLAVAPGRDYELVDSGDGEKLERYGPYLVRRPENQAIWPRRLSPRVWEGADAVFSGDVEEEGLGRWQFLREPLGETWPLCFDGLSYLGRFTSFRHVGVFPEQAAHWAFIEAEIARRTAAGAAPRLLNLFGYTGLASLVAARAGAEVTHVDASKKAIGWARENQEVAGLLDRPIRWICEDAVRYVEREVKRGRRYDIVLLDPPKFGRGPKGETWQLLDDLPYLVGLVRALLSERPAAVILTAYSIRSSFYSLGALMGEAFRGLGGRIEAGELVIGEAGEEPRLLSTSLFCRWIADD
ncbi:class I SAM-dependent methyltransferase [Jiella sonneratiae]|uniref:Class I SAM-dependent rRNA methyltransferase n=1 Tax=Jiella sonneratiae TaxID=2816856 RepID=A0ABS3J1Y3_9HYPH|nr:class I SAM-dependent methyltransferase [Jiella sonneratiae]MBO0903672.1 class I SAM-dependent rRNA methyltransferase [Jiella sonneratiae]